MKDQVITGELHLEEPPERKHRIRYHIAVVLIAGIEKERTKVLLLGEKERNWFNRCVVCVALRCVTSFKFSSS